MHHFLDLLCLYSASFDLWKLWTSVYVKCFCKAFTRHIWYVLKLFDICVCWTWSYFWSMRSCHRLLLIECFTQIQNLYVHLYAKYVTLSDHESSPSINQILNLFLQMLNKIPLTYRLPWAHTLRLLFRPIWDWIPQGRVNPIPSRSAESVTLFACPCHTIKRRKSPAYAQCPLLPADHIDIRRPPHRMPLRYHPMRRRRAVGAGRLEARGRIGFPCGRQTTVRGDRPTSKGQVVPRLFWSL